MLQQKRVVGTKLLEHFEERARARERSKHKDLEGWSPYALPELHLFYSILCLRELHRTLFSFSLLFSFSFRERELSPCCPATWAWRNPDFWHTVFPPFRLLCYLDIGILSPDVREDRKLGGSGTCLRGIGDGFLSAGLFASYLYQLKCNVWEGFIRGRFCCLNIFWLAGKSHVAVKVSLVGSDIFVTNWNWE